MLEGIYQAANEPHVARTLPICTIITPARFSIVAEDISDVYARKAWYFVSYLFHPIMPFRVGLIAYDRYLGYFDLVIACERIFSPAFNL